MTTRIAITNSRIGYEELLNNIYAYDADGSFTGEQVDDYVCAIVEKVNDRLPGSLEWDPHYSEILQDADDETEADLDDIVSLIDSVVAEVMEQEREESKMKWKNMNVMDRERVIHAAAKEVFNGTEYHWSDMLENLRDPEAEADHKNLDEEEAGQFWKEYFQDRLEAVRWSDEDSLAGTGLEHGQEYSDPTGKWMIVRANGETIVAKRIDSREIVNVDIDEVKCFIAQEI